MFERFTDRARRAVFLAQEEAGRHRHGYIGTEHLLLGLLAEEGGVAAIVLRRAGITLDGVRADVDRLVGPTPLGGGDAAALRAIGIDLDRVRDTVEAAFGPGALSPAGRCRQRRWRRSPRRAGGDATPFTPRAKKTMELAWRESLRLDHSYIATEHVLLGILGEGHGLAVQVLAERGVPAARLRADVLSLLGRVA